MATARQRSCGNVMFSLVSLCRRGRGHTLPLPMMHSSSLYRTPPPRTCSTHGWQMECFLVTARKRSLGQGNVFTHVCHSGHGGKGLCMMSLPVWSHVPSGGSLSRRCLLDRDSLDRFPSPYLKEQAVHILLECILVTDRKGG